MTYESTRIMSILAQVFQDLRFGLRLLRRSPVFAIVAVGSLGLGIGGSAAVFTLINAIVLRTLPIEEPDRLFAADRMRADEVVPRFSWLSVERLRDELKGRAEIAAASPVTAMLMDASGGGRGNERGYVQLVSGEYFDVLRQRPQHGRLLTPADNQSLDAHPVVVISDGFWKRQFGGRTDAIGRTIAFNGTPFTIVGVTRPDFYGTTVAVRAAEAWVPIMMQSAMRYGGNVSSHGTADTRKPWPPQAGVEWLNVFVRAPRTTSEQTIAAAMTVVHQSLLEASGDVDRTVDARLRSERVQLTPAARGISSLRTSATATLYVLLAMMIVLLLIACGNVAGLLTARATARQREIAVRLSLGAARRRLVQQMLVESVLLALCGGVLGLAIASWGRELLLRLFVTGQTTIVTLDAGMDWKVIGFASGVTLGAGVLCGLIPALRSTRTAIADTLKTQSRALGDGRRTLFVGRALVVAQMAFCLLLLVVAALFVRSLRALSATEIGFDRDHVLTARLDLRSTGIGPEARLELYRRVLDRLTAVPGVASASFSQNGPVYSSSQISGFSIEGYTPRQGERMTTNEEIVTDQYFSTVGLRVIEGRGFGPEDRGPDSKATLINQTMARKFFPNGGAVGKRWAYDSSQVLTPNAYVIIGVVEDAKYRDLRAAPPTMTYHLSGPSEDALLNDLEVRTSGAPEAMTATLRQVLAEAEPRLPIFDFAPLSARVSRAMSQDTVIAQLTSVFGGIALLLACLGLYATISYGVSRRIGELGLRIALGAGRSQVLWLVMREALIVVAIGAALGLTLSYFASHSLRTLLFGIGPIDPVAYSVAALLLVGVGLLAAFIPARRASRVEPMVAIVRN